MPKTHLILGKEISSISCCFSLKKIVNRKINGEVKNVATEHLGELPLGSTVELVARAQVSLSNGVSM